MESAEQALNRHTDPVINNNPEPADYDNVSSAGLLSKSGRERR